MVTVYPLSRGFSRHAKVIGVYKAGTYAEAGDGGGHPPSKIVLVIGTAVDDGEGLVGFEPDIFFFV